MTVKDYQDKFVIIRMLALSPNDVILRNANTIKSAYDRPKPQNAGSYFNDEEADAETLRINKAHSKDKEILSAFPMLDVG
jgi:hypothetical protein